MKNAAAFFESDKPPQPSVPPPLVDVVPLPPFKSMQSVEITDHVKAPRDGAINYEEFRTASTRWRSVDPPGLVLDMIIAAAADHEASKIIIFAVFLPLRQLLLRPSHRRSPRLT